MTAPVQTVTPFRELLADSSMTQDSQNYLLDCLKTIGSRQAVEVAQEFVARNPDAGRELLRKAGEVVELLGETTDITEKATVIVQSLSDVFQSAVEPGAQYIFIKGGSYVYSVTGKQVQVPDLYFAKYPVTNRLYRRFVEYLNSDAETFGKYQFPVRSFIERLTEYAYEISGFIDYLTPFLNLAKLFMSRYERVRRFNDNEQPVVGISWYAAKAYCLWLSLMESKGEKLYIYRLPMEIEWAWAASGNERREYPWGFAKPEDKLANYGRLIGTTLPVGSYPEGVTPEGLYDMAGNVWEWIENINLGYGMSCGGSWRNDADFLLCSSRNLCGFSVSRNDNLGFRVVRLADALQP